MKSSIFIFAEEQLKKGSIIICTIIRQSGSSPRGAGSIMVLTENGDIQGSIGGGRLEKTIIDRRQEFINQGGSRVLSFHLSEKDASDLDMICGGNISVLVEAIHYEERQLFNLFSNLNETIGRQGCGWLISEFNLDEGQTSPIKKTFVDLHGDSTGNIPLSVDIRDGHFKSFQLKGQQEQIHLEKNVNLDPLLIQTKENQLFIQPVGQFSKVVLIGAGHIAQKVALLTQSVGFYTVVMDDREAFLTKERFPFVDQMVVLPDFANVFCGINLDPNSYLVIVTRGHSSDKLVLQQALQTNAGYIGMIGSRRKIKATYDLLQKEGVTEENLNRVHSPIGLPIGAETPDEIAISILAELIQERSRAKELKI